MAKPYSIVPPREPLGFIDGKPVEVSRVWWRFFSSLFTTTGGGQPGGGGNDNLNDLYALAYSTVEPAGTDVDSRFNEIDLLLQAARPGAGAAPSSPDMEALRLLAGPRPQERQQTLDSLLAAGHQASAQEPRADLLLPARIRGTDFDAATAELRKLIMAIRPQRVSSSAELGLGTMAFQNANAVDIVGGVISVVGEPVSATGGFLTTAGTGATRPSSTVSGAQLWTDGSNNSFVTMTDGSRSANNHVVEWVWSGGTLIGRFVNDAANSALNFMVVSGGFATGVTSISMPTLAVSGSFATGRGTADQSFSFQTPATGFTITIGPGIKTLILDPATTLATGSITMPGSPVNGQEIRIASSQTITALTVLGNTGQTVKNSPTSLIANATGGQGYAFIFRLANATWYRTQ